MALGKKILIASSSFISGEGLKSVLTQLGYSIVNFVTSQDQLERSIVKDKPDYVFINLPKDVFRIEKTIAFLSITSPAKTILLSDSLQKEACEKYLKVGIKAIVSSGIEEASFKDMLSTVHNGDVYTDQYVREILSFDKEKAFKDTCAELNISDREVEIIILIAEGYINKEIADRLFLSTHTVNTHRKNIMSKLGVGNATGVVLFAVKEKLISPKEFLFSSKH